MAHIPLRDISKTIPTDIHACGYKGIAAAVTYLCCMDIAYDYMDRCRNNDFCRPNSINCGSAKEFLARKDNPLYILDIPGEEMIRDIERRAKEAYERRSRKGR